PTLPPFAFPSILSSCLVSLFVVRSVPPKSYPLPLHDALPISVSKMQTGPVSAVQDISASLGSAFGIMVLGSVSTAVFRSHLSSTDRKSTRLNSSHVSISYAVFCFKKNDN